MQCLPIPGRAFLYDSVEGAEEFAMRRFAYVLKWAGIVVLLSTLLVRVPLLLAYFMNIPNVLDYQPLQRLVMCLFIIAFASVQVSLALHNEDLSEAIRAHFDFLRRNGGRFGWFLLICALHFFFLMSCDAIVRGAIEVWLLHQRQRVMARLDNGTRSTASTSPTRRCNRNMPGQDMAQITPRRRPRHLR